MGSIKKDVVEGLAALLVCTFGDYVSGIFLHLAKPIIASFPFILGLLPIASDARGDVYSSYGSRLGTLLHLGIGDRYMKIELLSLTVLIVYVNLWIALLYYVLANVLCLPSANPVTLIFIVLLSATLSACFMIPTTTVVARVAFRKGLDPDNIVSPIATFFGDMVTIPTLLAGLYASWILSSGVQLAVIALLVSLATAFLVVMVRRCRRGIHTYRRGIRIVMECLATVIVATSFSAVAGVVLTKNLDVVLCGGLLAVVPAFLEDGGAIACRFSSKLSTAIHLGKLRLRPVPRDPWIARQILVNLIHSTMVFALVGVFGATITFLSNTVVDYVFIIFATVQLAGMLLTVIMSVVTYYLALLAFKLGLDPDNVLAPILTSIADALGTTLLVTTYLLIA